MTIKIRVVYNYDRDSVFCEMWNKMTDGNCTFTKKKQKCSIVW